MILTLLYIYVKTAERNQFIEANREKYSVQTMCEVLNLSRSTYYQFQKKEASPRHKENQLITKRMIEIHQDSKGHYGASKITIF
ncbi:hypothetical protein ABHN05_20515 [Brevibacillus laterosporus]|uniref:hypothetical protein n=1 Tax=Brevibacillus laterosporus TaxID=1465 RepID=UPI003D1C16BB